MMWSRLRLGPARKTASLVSYAHDLCMAGADLELSNNRYWYIKRLRLLSFASLYSHTSSSCDISLSAAGKT